MTFPQAYSLRATYLFSFEQRTPAGQGVTQQNIYAISPLLFEETHPISTGVLVEQVLPEFRRPLFPNKAISRVELYDWS